MEPTIEAFVNQASKKDVGEFIEAIMVNYSDWPAYIGRYPDLSQVENGLTHYLYYGAKEKRMNVSFSLPPKPVEPPTPPIPPTPPNGWQPPSTPGMHEICKVPGGHFMGGLRIPTGILIGSYQPAKILHFDGQIKEELSTSAESFYSFRMTPDGNPIVTSEKNYGRIYKRSNGWHEKSKSNSEPAVTFEPYQIGDSLYCFRPDVAWGSSQTILKGDINGDNWTPYRTLSGKQLLNMGSDGKTLGIAGNANNCPLLADENGAAIVTRPDYQNTTYAFVVGLNGAWSIGGNRIQYNGEGAFIDLYDGTVRSVQDVVQPYIMSMKIKDGIRYAIASVWNESGPQAALWKSSNGAQWTKTEIPMQTCISMDFGDGGVYLFGGKYNEYGKVCFLKF